jgi:hypothetical protein
MQQPLRKVQLATLSCRQAKRPRLLYTALYSLLMYACNLSYEDLDARFLVSNDTCAARTRGNRGEGDPRGKFKSPQGGGRVPPWGEGLLN